MARTATLACSLLPEYESSRPCAWLSAVLLTALAVTASAPTIGTALAKEGPDTKKEDTTTVVNWLGTHAVELAPGTYHEPKTVANLVALVNQAYRAGRHIRPVGSALLPNGLTFDHRGMVGLSNLDNVLDIDKENMTVTVEAGARVLQVLDALRPHGLTLPNLVSIAKQQVGGLCQCGRARDEGGDSAVRQVCGGSHAHDPLEVGRRQDD